MVAASMLLSTPTARADANDFTFDSFEADYYLSQDSEGYSTLRTVETLVAVFPPFDQNHGIERAIPSIYDGHDTNVTIETVTDEAGGALSWSTYRSGDFLVVRIGDAWQYAHGPTTYVLTYTQSQVTKHFSDTRVDEFYWDTNGTGWQQPFAEVAARVHVDPSLVPAMVGEPSCYVGPSGSTAGCPITSSSDGLVSASAENVGPNETVTVALGFATGTFRQSTVSAAYLIERIVPLIPAAALLALLITAAIARLTVWRPPRGRGIKIVQYSPPDPEDLHLSAIMIDQPKRGLPAAIINLAVDRRLRILDDPEGRAPGERFTLAFVTADGASDRDRELLDALFGPEAEPGKICELDGQSLEMARRLRALVSQAETRVTESGLRAPIRRRLKSFVRGWSMIALIGAFLVAILASAEVFHSQPVWVWWVTAILGIVVVIVIALLSSQKPELTRAGHDYRDHLEGMREYLQLAEEDRLRMLQSPEGAERVVTGSQTVVKVYEKLLPYAVLWGVEDQWSRELQIQYAAAGTSAAWAAGDLPLSPVFTSALIHSSQSSAAVPEPVTTSYSSSSSGGWSSSGGSSSSGSSGGGGGGGGGGGW